MPQQSAWVALRVWSESHTQSQGAPCPQDTALRLCVLKAVPHSIRHMGGHLGSWAGPLVAASAEFLSSLPWAERLSGSALRTHGHCQNPIAASTCSNPDPEPPSISSSNVKLDSFSFIALSYSSPPASLLWSGILFWRRKPFMLELEYRNIDQAIHYWKKILSDFL